MLAAEIFYHNLNFIIPGGTSRGVLKNKPTWYIKIYHNDNPSIFGLGECGPIQGLSIESGDKMMDQLKKVKESINDFERESFITEDNVDVLRSIVKNKQNKSVKFQDGKKAKVDLFTASALTQVLDKVNPDNKAKLTKMINGTLKSFLQAQSAVMKLAKMK